MMAGGGAGYGGGNGGRGGGNGGQRLAPATVPKGGRPDPGDSVGTKPIGPRGAFNQARGGNNAGGGGGKPPKPPKAPKAPRVPRPSGGPKAANTKPNVYGPGSAAYAGGQALAQAEYGPTIAEDRRQIGVNNRQGAAAEKLTAGYYNQLERFTKQGMNAERGIATGLTGQLRNIAGAENARLGQIDTNALSSMRSYTPGSSPGDNSLRAPAINSLVQQIALQKSLANSDEGAFRSTGALQGANAREFAASNLGTNALAGQEFLGNIAEGARLANEPIVAQIAALRAKRGALAAADITKLRQLQITNNLTRIGLGQKQQALNITANYDKGRLALEKRAQDISQTWHEQEVKLGLLKLSQSQRAQVSLNNYRNAEIRIAKAKAAIAAGKTPAKPKLTTHENDYYQSQLDTAVVAIKSGVSVAALEAGSGRIGTKEKTATGGNTIHYTSFPRVPSAIAQAAWDLAHYWFLSIAQLNMLHAIGMTGVTYQGRPVKVRDLSSVKSSGLGSNPF